MKKLNNDLDENLSEINFAELPMVSVLIKKTTGDFETESIDLCVKGFYLKECVDKLFKIKKEFLKK